MDNNKDINESTNATGVTNKADCYFYYYSSCNKGNTCPYRHEPAALRNESMCKFWLQGNCTRPNCMYRHMELTKKRDKIPCYFESNGGCKKLYCAFMHNNVQDQIKDEDVPKNPDVILPVKNSEAEYETEDAKAKRMQANILSQLRAHRHMADPEERDIPSPPMINKHPIIVDLNDCESDSDCCPSPKKFPSKNVDDVEELEKLRQIRVEEGNILGYSFRSNPDSTHSSDSEEFIEETIYISDDSHVDEDDSVHPRLRSSPISWSSDGSSSSINNNPYKLQRNKRKVIMEKEQSTRPRPVQKPDVRQRLGTPLCKADSQQERKESFPPRRSLPTKAALKESRLSFPSNRTQTSDSDPLCGRLNFGSEPNICESDLGFRNSSTLSYSQSSLVESRVVSIKDRLKVPNTQSNDLKSPNNCLLKTLTKALTPSTDITAMSLSSLIGANNGSSRATEDISPDVTSIKIKTLAEIRAEKNQQSSKRQQLKQVSPPTTIRSEARKSATIKRPISPIRFEDSTTPPSNKRTKTNGVAPTIRETAVNHIKSLNSSDTYSCEAPKSKISPKPASPPFLAQNKLETSRSNSLIEEEELLLEVEEENIFKDEFNEDDLLL